MSFHKGRSEHYSSQVTPVEVEVGSESKENFGLSNAFSFLYISRGLVSPSTKVVEQDLSLSFQRLPAVLYRLGWWGGG